MALDENRWASLTFAEQMANIGSEVGRTAKWMAKGKSDFAHGAYIRALELCRARDCFTEAYLNSDMETLSFLDKYFTQFAIICRR